MFRKSLFSMCPSSRHIIPAKVHRWNYYAAKKIPKFAIRLPKLFKFFLS